jgi:outer membrane protein OmpA-like peptidoglycan-associated protein/opacity protein-like surface antigen
MKKLILVLLLAVVLMQDSTPSFAQAKWEGGLFVGASNYQGDVVLDPAFTLKETNLAYGVFLKRRLNHSWLIRANWQGGRLSGKDENFEDDGRQKRRFSFDSPINEFSLLAEWELLGKRRMSDGGTTRKIFTPYLFAGLGVAIHKPEPFFNETGNSEPSFLAKISNDKNADFSTTNFVTPIGAGLRLDLASTINLSLEFGYRPPFSDYLDGISESANPDKNDWYVFGGALLAVKLGKGKDTDADGVSDNEDQCPDTPGLLKFAGCPDKDSDGIADKNDRCPDVAGLEKFNGCPDTDGDGIIDSDDQCPSQAGPVAMKGCPDTDKDGISDQMDRCPNEAGLANLGGCPDSDNDGIEDAKDRCPREAGPASNNGCPNLDTDGDGVLDKDDKCPNAAGMAQFMGCPDTDNDGLSDVEDKCPNTVGPKSNGGCPELKVEEKKILSTAVKKVQFEFASANLMPTSYTILDQVVEILKNYPDYYLTIKGYTDDRGNEIVNQQLSENRANACLEYLVSKGIARNRITAKGYGETTPLATNETDEGRAQNRRVEFDLQPR